MANFPVKFKGRGLK